MKRKPSTAPAAQPSPEEPPVKTDQIIMFLYPRHPFFGVMSVLEPHLLRVDSIRDLHAEPISKIEVEIQPTLLRGRWLVQGIETHTRAPAEFYTDYMRGIHEIPAELAEEGPATLFGKGVTR